MKRILLSSLSLFTFLGTNAQQLQPTDAHVNYAVGGNNVFDAQAGEKTTTKSDTIVYSNNSSQISANTDYRYYVDLASSIDSGYYLGTNAYGYKGWAEAYNITAPHDTAMAIIGTMSVWHGAYKLTTNKMVNIEVWDVDTIHGTYLNPAAFVVGYPNNVLVSQSVPIKSLRMGYNYKPDTVSAITWFNTPVNVSGYFFVGYEMTYDFHSLNGDTICIRATKQGTGTGHTDFYDIDGMGDTLYHARNAVEMASGSWIDPYWQAHLNVNLSIVPIIQRRDITGVSSISKDNFTYYGLYPNPAANNMRLKINAKTAAHISISIMDIGGRQCSFHNNLLLSVGMNELPLDVENLGAGSYICLISYTSGAMFAEKFSIVK